MGIKITTNDFIYRARKVHGDRYDYSCTKYEKMHSKVTIKCKIHGVFEQISHNHVNGQGCPSCSGVTKRLTVEKFVIVSQQKHGNKYDYSLVKCKNNRVRVVIVCPKHGIFKQRPVDHMNGCGCPICGRGNFSRKAMDWLNYLVEQKGVKIQHKKNGGEFRIPGTRYKADGFCKDTNTVYEFYGDRFHGNPLLFSSSECCHPFNSLVTAGQLYEQTLRREQIIKQKGFNLVTIWESAFDGQGHVK